jgi:hypothetical protein
VTLPYFPFISQKYEPGTSITDHLFMDPGGGKAGIFGPLDIFKGKTGRNCSTITYEYHHHHL